MQEVRKGKLGLSLAFYPTLAFASIVLGLAPVAWGVLVVVLLKEDDEWAKRQCLQAAFSSFITGGILLISTSALKIPVIGWIVSIILAIPALVFWIMQLVSLSRVRKFGEANFPVLWKYAYKALGSEPPVYAAAPQYQQYPQGQAQYQPQQYPQYQQPYAAPGVDPNAVQPPVQDPSASNNNPTV